MLGVFKNIIDFILPPRCLVCGKVINNDNGLCKDCFSNINFITLPYCHKCGTPLAKTIKDNNFLCMNCLNPKNKNIFRISRSMVEYDTYSKKIILDFKFLDHLESKNLLVNWLEIAGKDIFEEGVDLILPIPLHYTRVFERKYNQSAILAKELAKRKNISVLFDCLKKCKKTIPQVKCTGKNKRRKNVKGAFVVIDKDKIKGKRILLIDDVYTTGATLNECAKVLLKAGALSVDTLTIAKVC
ncbi:MAG: ComF family protein [Alphaproteobacteria bacterium]|nr:ComF family protein [Alphaproteobacteria bacterium]